MATEGPTADQEESDIPDPHGDIAAGRYTRYLNSEEFVASFEADA